MTFALGILLIIAASIFGTLIFVLKHQTKSLTWPDISVLLGICVVGLVLGISLIYLR